MLRAQQARILGHLSRPPALNCEHKVIDPRLYGLSRRQLRARAEEIAIGSWALVAVHQVIEETTVALIASASAATAAASG